MARTGIFFGTDTGRTRKVAKLIAKKLGDLADAPVNVNRLQAADLLNYEVLILGTPTYGDGMLPGLDFGSQASWGEFLPQLDVLDFSGKTVALFGLGEQERYPDYFVDGMGLLYDALLARGARFIGDWSTAGYTFTASAAVDEDRFVGLALDVVTQDRLTESRIDAWLAKIRPHLPA